MTRIIVSLLAFSFAAAPGWTAELKIPFEKYTLANGLRVILSEDHSAPVASVYVMYNVGARAEEKGRTGFAHLFEHMMFEGSGHAPKGLEDKLVEGNGGYLNGSTHPDYTEYFDVLPSNKVALALWLQGDKMHGLDLTEAALANQKEAVKQERRLSVDNRPYNTAIVDKWPEVAFRNWSNAHSIIGSFDDLNAATIGDVRKFFKTYYAPNNAILVVAGDIQPAEIRKLVTAYFGDLEAQPQPVRPNLSEPPQTAARVVEYTDPLAQVPAVVIGFPGPLRRSPSYYALGMLDMVLTGGDSSRFQQDLVKGKQSVVQFESDLGWPFAGFSDYKFPGMYAMNLLYNPRFTAQQIAGQVREEIDRIEKDGVGEAELNRARATLRAGRLRELQRSLSRAQMLARYELFDGDPGAINTELDDFLAVTPAQIQAVARQYLVPEKQSMLAINLKKREGK